MRRLTKLQLVKGLIFLLLYTVLFTTFKFVNKLYDDFNLNKSIEIDEKSFHVNGSNTNLSADFLNNSTASLELDVIRTQYLTAPPISIKQRKLAKKVVRKSPVTAYVRQLLKNKRNGFFVEAGANDGEYLSNTLELELDDGWSGLLVEPIPVPQRQLIAIKRDAWVASCCLSPIPCATKMKMVSHSKWPALGNIPQYFSGVATKETFNRTYQVQCFPLHSLLAAIGQTEVDYLSLDIEGAELPVLKTIPFETFSFRVISVEAVEKSENKITQFLSQHGYQKMKYIKQPFVHDYIYMKGVVK